MKSYLMCFLAGMIFLAACKKTEIKSEPIASLNVANAIVGGKFVRFNTNSRDSAGVYSYKLFGIKAGGDIGIKLFASSTPNNPYFNQNPAIENGGVYSIFLTGTPAVPESVFVKDNIPAYSRDSIVRVRVVNLSPDIGTINVTLSSAQAINVFSNLAYKGLSNFADVPLKTIIPTGSNVFQIRDASNTLKASYTLPASGTISIQSARFKNITLVVKGLVGGTGIDAIGVIPIPNF